LIEAVLIGETTRFLDRDGKLPMDWEGWCLTLGEAFGVDGAHVNDTLTEHGVRALANGTRVSRGGERG
jgi:hypothetical protein